MGVFGSPGPWEFHIPIAGRTGSGQALAMPADPALPLFKGLLAGGLLSGVLWSAAILPLLL